MTTQRAAALITAAMFVMQPGSADSEAGLNAKIRGVIRAFESASLATDQPLRALAVNVREGDHFRRGDILIRFDCAKRQAERNAAKAAAQEAELNLKSARTLDRYRAIGKLEIAIAQQRYEKVKYELAAINADLSQCSVAAPFDGRVASLDIRRLERTSANKPFLRIVSSDQLEVETIVPSRFLAHLKKGSHLRVQIDEMGGRTIGAIVNNVGAVVDPVSKTVKVTGRIKDPSDLILPGMSGTLIFRPEN